MKIEDRVSRLEKRHRNQVLALSALGLLVLAYIAWDQAGPIPDVLQAHRIEVVNRDRSVVFFAGETNAGHGVLATYNAAGQPILSSIPGTAGDGHLKLSSADGVTRIELNAMNAIGSGGGILLKNASGEIVVGLFPDSAGHGTLQLCHGSENRCDTYEYTPGGQRRSKL